MNKRVQKRNFKRFKKTLGKVCLTCRFFKLADSFNIGHCSKLDDDFFRFTFLSESCREGRWEPALENPFAICQRICDFNLENCGHCTEPLQCDEWRLFWNLIGFEYLAEWLVRGLVCFSVADGWNPIIKNGEDVQ